MAELVQSPPAPGAGLTEALLAAIVEGSDDAIISKTLDGVVTSWNAGAQRIFGYRPDEMIGQSILKLIPPELHSEENDILGRLRRGDRIEHFDTVRVAKDGRRIDISLTISPLRNRTGAIIGASKIARDVTERKRAEEMQRLLFNELNHRVKNMLASIQAIAGQSLRAAEGPEQFVEAFNGRIRSLALAHDLLVQGRMEGADMFGLVRDQVVLGAPDGRNIAFSGPHVVIEDQAALQLALVLHELATNARKYGALSRPEGHLSITWRLETEPERALLLQWRETGIGPLHTPARRGFGTRLIERSLDANGGEAAIRYGEDGLSCDIRLPLPDRPSTLRGPAGREPDPGSTGRGAAPAPGTTGRLRGLRVLLVEDEPLIAMDIEEQLRDAGCAVVGPATTMEAALRLAGAGDFDIALLDGNLGGQPVGAVAAALARRGAPFLFATGYGRDALPSGFEHVPALTKPFTEAELRSALGALARPHR